MSKLPKIRLYLPGVYEPGATLSPDDSQIHYLANVMRQKAGDVVGIFNGTDGEWAADIVDIGKRSCSLRLTERVRAQREPPDLELLFAPVKKARIDYLAQKATEMGARVLQPVMTAYTNAERIKVERLQANVVEAAEQCTLTFVPQVRDPHPLGRCLDGLDRGRKLLFCDEGGAPTPQRALAPFKRGEPWAILIGPEGGFSPEERAMIRTLPQTVPMSLGPRIMRADTAVVAAMAAWQSALGDWHE
jgi:16S rRNA (uracil1498-N3)-methyltransferase